MKNDDQSRSTESTRHPITISRRSLLSGFAVVAGGLGLAGCSAGTIVDNEGSGSSEKQPTDSNPTTVRIGTLQGPTGMGLVGLMDACGALKDLAAQNNVELPENDNPADIAKLVNTYEFTLAGSADELTPQLIQGDLDVLCVPANLAATLYQKTEGEVTVLCVNTLGVLDIVEAQDTIHDFSDLAGRTIYSAGRGSTPQFALEYLLRENAIDPDKDVTIQWVSEHSECLAALQSDPSIVCMLPQPFATSAIEQVKGARIALDLTDVWDDTTAANGDNSQLITGVAVARRSFVDEYPGAIDELLDAYPSSVAFVNDNHAEAAKLIEAAGIVKAQIAEKAIPYCHIVCVTDSEMREALEGYLKTLYDADPQSVGGEMPSDDFYYEE